MKTVGFYGHSNCAYRGGNSHVDLFAKHFGLDVVNLGVKQGSEERILYELKKTKELDLAVIFHCEPQYLFLPGCDRDIGLNHLKEHRANYLFENWDNDHSLEHNKRFIEKFKTPENFIMAIQAYKDYFYSIDLQINRFSGALVQIDGYLTAKNIPSIHVIGKSFPNWFKFTSGAVDKDIQLIIKNNSVTHGTFNVNCISDTGNQLIFERLTELVETLQSPSPGRLAEWPNASISKIDNPQQGFVGSNPTSSAI